ncbi:Neuropeptide SIFamide receptor-like 6 [Homarus americanus]|uniref:Neuropeptide SIFamide receptor-like 6 n=1 Tax=Homarus americanus TaxID=6706 RepID=A0A8J5MY00_HOMAM|nr:Neuropeptide SIFamide receptor-like 6 [Homarus americanus]
MSYLQGVSVSASINTLVAISVDRAMAICYPMKCQITSRTCRSIIVVIWVFSLTITLPWAIFFNLEPIPETDLHVCTDRWPDEQSGNLYFVLANLIMCYLLPLTAISVCYILIWRKWLGASNSCINPVLYAFFNDKFRSGFKAILVSRSCCSPLRLDSNCKNYHSSVRAHNLCSLESKASSEFSIYSSSSGSAETRRKSVLVQIPLDSHSPRTTVTTTTSASEKKRSVVSQRTRRSMVLYRQCIINNFTNGAASTTATTTTTTTTTAAATSTSTPSSSSTSSFSTTTQVNGSTTLV